MNEEDLKKYGPDYTAITSSSIIDGMVYINKERYGIMFTEMYEDKSSKFLGYITYNDKNENDKKG